MLHPFKVVFLRHGYGQDNSIGKAILSGLPVVFFESAPPAISARFDFSFPPVNIQVIPGSVYTDIFC